MLARRVVAVFAGGLLLSACSLFDDDTSGPGVAPLEADGDATGSAGPDADSEKPEPARDAGELEDAPVGLQPAGFTTATIRVTDADGEVCDVCVWLADSADERGRGLMGVTDLGEPVGMLFRFDAPVDGRFFMFGTPMPLSIGWFDVGGSFVGEADMEPCLTDDSSECERYGPGAEFVWAVEMVQGELDVIGIGPGARLEVLAEHETCP